MAMILFSSSKQHHGNYLKYDFNIQPDGPDVKIDTIRYSNYSLVYRI